MNSEYEGTKEIQGSSDRSIQDAIQDALTSNPRTSNYRSLIVESITVEEGGVVGGIIYRVALNPQPLPPESTES